KYAQRVYTPGAPVVALAHEFSQPAPSNLQPRIVSMKFRSFLRFFGVGRWESRNRRKKGGRPAARPARIRLCIEGLEERTLMSVIPPAVIDKVQAISGPNAIQPSIAIDPVNPQKLVALWSTGTVLNARDPYGAAYSLDGGTTWQAFTYGVVGQTNGVGGANLPNFLPWSPLRFGQADGNRYQVFVLPTGLYQYADEPRVAIDRNENIYFLWHTRDVKDDSGLLQTGGNVDGAIWLNKYDFTGLSPQRINLNGDKTDLSPFSYGNNR